MVLTPYKQQVYLLEKTFEPVLEKFKYSRDSLYLSTVDSSQGQERSVVMYSCVRASVSNTTGFVDDVKRLNVAITRAKKALWVIVFHLILFGLANLFCFWITQILGNVASLSRSDVWSDLIENAKSRECIIHNSFNELFPNARKEAIARKREDDDSSDHLKQKRM